MRPEQLEARMRSFEYFHSWQLLPETWIVLRVDGHGFSNLTAAHFEKPFDARFHQAMLDTTRALLERFQGIYAYTESDEISLLLPKRWNLFNRELEKAISLSAGVASSTFALASGLAGHFDSRVWLGTDAALVVDYFRWRQADAARCALNGWGYWTLRKAGWSAGAATAELKGKSCDFKQELLFEHGTNFNDLPIWQRHGTGLYWESYEKEGVDPRNGQTNTAVRRRVRTDETLPRGDEYGRFLSRLLVEPVMQG